MGTATHLDFSGFPLETNLFHGLPGRRSKPGTTLTTSLFAGFVAFGLRKDLVPVDFPIRKYGVESDSAF